MTNKNLFGHSVMSPQQVLESAQFIGQSAGLRVVQRSPHHFQIIKPNSNPEISNTWIINVWTSGKTLVNGNSPHLAPKFDASKSRGLLELVEEIANSIIAQAQS